MVHPRNLIPAFRRRSASPPAAPAPAPEAEVKRPRAIAKRPVAAPKATAIVKRHLRRKREPSSSGA